MLSAPIATHSAKREIYEERGTLIKLRTQELANHILGRRTDFRKAPNVLLSRNRQLAKPEILNEPDIGD
jgi:hypothetical protein